MPKPLKDPVTVERLRELLNYDPDTGEVRWRMATSNRVKAGDRAGSDKSTGHGYPTIGIDGRRLLLHRVVFALHNGYWPAALVDHRDRTKSNIKADNLRDATHSDNLVNKSKRTASGHPGVGRMKGRWQARVAGRSLGVFDTAEEAAAAYQTAHAAHYGDLSPYGDNHV